MYGGLEVYASPERTAELQEKEGATILAGADAVLQEAGVASSKEVLVGPIGPTIAQRADQLHCDGIVMGTRGMGALGNLLLGSVATKVIHFAQVPVTLVK